MFLYIVLDRKKIDLGYRLAHGRFLDPGEIEEIVCVCKSTLTSSFEAPPDSTKPRQKKVLSLEKVRMSMTRKKLDTDVEPETIAIRLQYIRQYLVWLMNVAILRTPVSTSPNLVMLRDLTKQMLENKTPRSTGRNHMYQRMGLDEESQALLLRIIDPASPNNPWGSGHTKVRNALTVRMLLELGVRRSELLGVRIKDISTQGKDVKILRRPDDKDDPRLYEPNAKTRDRILPLSPELFQAIKDYIFLRRTIVRGRHDFLLVANGTGAPLSISEFNRLFHCTQAVSQKLQYLIPHLLRHTFFENLCEDLDKNGVPVEEWEPMLRRLGGWSDTSATPCRYTKRYSQRKAKEAMLSMQKKLNMKVPHDE